MQMAVIAASKWNGRAVTDSTVDRMLDAIHMIADKRANGEDECTIALAVAERVELMRASMILQFDGHEVY